MKMSAPRSRRSPSKSRQSPPKSRQVPPKRRAPLSLQRASSPARKQPRAISVPSPTADRRGGPLLYLGHAWPCKDIFRVEFSNESAAATLLFMLTSHDLVPRDENTNGYANEMKRLERHFQRKEMSGWLYSAYYYSSFTYSLIGFAMVLYFNRRLPDKFWQAAALNVDAFALILVAQGPLSFWADVFARTALCAPQHVAYLADRMSAAPMTVLTLYLGIVCWHEPSSEVGRSIAATSAIGLVPFLGSQLALRRGDYTLFMKLHIAWHVSIPLVACLWLGHTCHGWFTS